MTMETSGAVIKPNNNGPYIVTGSFTIQDPSGKVYKVEGDRVALCRCGGSNNKPFCDATHRSNGFSSECVAPD